MRVALRHQAKLARWIENPFLRRVTHDLAPGTGIGRCLPGHIVAGKALVAHKEILLNGLIQRFCQVVNAIAEHRPGRRLRRGCDVQFDLNGMRDKHVICHGSFPSIIKFDPKRRAIEPLVVFLPPYILRGRGSANIQNLKIFVLWIPFPPR